MCLPLTRASSDRTQGNMLATTMSNTRGVRAMTQGSNEPLRDYLDRRERELAQEIEELRNQLIPKEAELAEVRRAMSALVMTYGSSLLKDIFAHATSVDASNMPQHSSNTITPDAWLTGSQPTPSPVPMPMPALYDAMSIKQLVIRALWDHFCDTGATADELCDFFGSAYGRHVGRSSLGPQLSRLRGIYIEQVPKTGKWRLIPDSLASPR